MARMEKAHIDLETRPEKRSSLHSSAPFSLLGPIPGNNDHCGEHVPVEGNKGSHADMWKGNGWTEEANWLERRTWQQQCLGYRWVGDRGLITCHGLRIVA